MTGAIYFHLYKSILRADFGLVRYTVDEKEREKKVV